MHSMNSPTTPIQPGCYIDSHHGHYSIPASVALAQSAGFSVDADDQAILDRYEADCFDENYPIDVVIELSDCAVDWLNGLYTGPFQPEPPKVPHGHAWMWNDGDFGLYPVDDD